MFHWMRISTALLALLTTAVSPSRASEYEVVGKVISAGGNPAVDADVSPFWRSNGSPTAKNGGSYNLLDPKQNAIFWGNVGEMEPFQPPVQTSTDGEFKFTLAGRKRHLLAMNKERTLGAVVEIPRAASSDSPIEIRLQPLVKVIARVKSAVPMKPVDWSHVTIEMPFNPEFPLSTRRLVSCGSYDRRFEFHLPPGNYVVEAYGNSDRVLDELDLRAKSNLNLSIDGDEKVIDLGTIELSKSRPYRGSLEKEAKEAGRWHDYTKHIGEPAPTWHAIETRGIPEKSDVSDFRGKWLAVYFWGLGCAPCLGKGIPQAVEFYETHADQKDRFEIVGVCIDIHEEVPDLKTLDRKLKPIIENVWNGKRIPFPIALDDSFTSWERFGIRGLGSVVLVDPDGNLCKGDLTTLEQILKNENTHSREQE